MPSDTENFRIRLAQKTGYSDSAISAAWPEWWSTAAEASPSAQAELRFSVARKLGLDPRSLLDDDGPQFMWDDSAKYKHFKGDVQRERPAITSFGTSIARMLVQGVAEHGTLTGISAAELRSSILAGQQFVRFQDLLALLWGIGIPAIHLRVHPLAAKRMCAMAVSVGNRYAILLAKDSQFPASVAFHLAHEIGHIALGHVEQGSAVIDMEDPAEFAIDNDDEEKVSDRFALELLTGDPDFSVGKAGRGRSPKQLAEQALAMGFEHRIEPGTLALCYGHVTGEWPTVQAAMPYIYQEPIPAWLVTNHIATQQLSWDRIGDENADFIHAVMGGM